MANRPRKSRQPACPKCGLEQDRWKTPQGFVAHAEAYCCEDCAFDTGCLCVGAPEDARFSQFKRGGSLGAQPGI